MQTVGESENVIRLFLIGINNLIPSSCNTIGYHTLVLKYQILSGKFNKIIALKHWLWFLFRGGFYLYSYSIFLAEIIFKKKTIFLWKIAVYLIGVLILCKM